MKYAILSIEIPESLKLLHKPLQVVKVEGDRIVSAAIMHTDGTLGDYMDFIHEGFQILDETPISDLFDTEEAAIASVSKGLPRVYCVKVPYTGDAPVAGFYRVKVSALSKDDALEKASNLEDSEVFKGEPSGSYVTDEPCSVDLDMQDLVAEELPIHPLEPVSDVNSKFKLLDLLEPKLLVTGYRVTHELIPSSEHLQVTTVYKTDDQLLETDQVDYCIVRKTGYDLLNKNGQLNITARIFPEDSYVTEEELSARREDYKFHSNVEILKACDIYYTSVLSRRAESQLDPSRNTEARLAQNITFEKDES